MGPKARELLALVRASQGQPLRKKLVTLVFDSSQPYAWGGETILLNDEAVGEISSVGYSPLAGGCVALGYVRGLAVPLDGQGQPVSTGARERAIFPDYRATRSRVLWSAAPPKGRT